jgi:hypothetical protein
VTCGTSTLHTVDDRDRVRLALLHEYKLEQIELAFEALGRRIMVGIDKAA